MVSPMGVRSDGCARDSSMKSPIWTPLLLGLLMPGCPSDGNPHKVWLAPDQMETRVKLIDHEPDPF